MEDRRQFHRNRRTQDAAGSPQAFEAGAQAGLSTIDAAAILGVTERTVRRAITRGELVAIKQGSTYRIARDDLDRYAARETYDAAPRPLAQIVPFPAQSEAFAPLPSPISSFVGREAELDRLSPLLADGSVRLLTLTGPGGIGKTRLAIAAAGAAGDDFPDGVVFVPLADVTRPELVLPAIADALGLREVAGRERRAQVRSFLQTKHVLLVLDNFEHVLTAAPDVVQLAVEAPQLTVLVTSRAPLRVQGEREWPVPPLVLPQAETRDVAAGSRAAIERSEAVQLFVERARAHDPSFSVDDASAPLVADICARLDGLPLAIELAAARTTVLSPRQMRERLHRSLPILTTGDRNAPARHRTMRDAIAWSYEALSPAAQPFFRQLAVFRGGCTLEAAEWMAREAGEAEKAGPVSPPDALEMMDALIGQSLLQRERGIDGEPRFRMLGTIREYGLERQAPAEQTAFRAAHAAYFLTLARTLRPMVDTQATRGPLDQLAADDANLRDALEWLHARGPAADFVSLVAALSIYWFGFSHQREAATWLERALEQRDRASDGDRGALLIHYGELLTLQGNSASAEPIYAEGLALLHGEDAPFDLALALMSAGASLNFGGKYVEAEAYLNDGLAAAGTIADRTLRAAVSGGVLANLSVTARGKEDFALAETRSEEALRRYRGHGFDLAETRSLMDLAGVAKDQGDHQQVVDRYLTCLARTGERGDMRVVADALTGIAGAATAWGEHRCALLLFGAANALRERVALGLLAPADLALIERDLATLRQSTGELADAILEEGRNLSFAEAVNVAHMVEGAQERQLTARAVRGAALTRREQAVLELLVAGQTDREIAEALFMSPRTASWHVSIILEKLGFSTRREAIAHTRPDTRMTKAH